MLIDGLEKRLALIHFYFGEEPDTFDRIALLWGRLAFVLELEGKFAPKEKIIKG